MDWTDEGIVLGTRRHGEANAILEVMTRQHGRHLGLVRGGSSSRLRPVLQPGNVVRAVWRARLDEHLGHYTVEALQLHGASLLAASHVVYGVTHLAALCRLLPERDPHPEVHDWLTAALQKLDDPLAAGAEMVRFELRMLAELGFGLDLSSCAATGDDSDLAYVSPKSGRAVSRGAGAPWQDRLLRLPAFVVDAAQADAAAPSHDDLADGFALTGFFLARHVLEPRGLAFADAREGFVTAVLGRRNGASAS
jgi:DNA repair protein RecO (recombination protein O)